MPLQTILWIWCRWNRKAYTYYAESNGVKSLNWNIAGTDRMKLDGSGNLEIDGEKNNMQKQVLCNGNMVLGKIEVQIYQPLDRFKRVSKILDVTNQKVNQGT